MINVDYSNREIKVKVEKISTLFKLPLKFSVISNVSNKEIWSCDLNDNWWATYPNNEINNTKIVDANNNLVFEKKWNVLEDGSYLYKSLYYFCQNILYSENRKPNGLVVGSHDGEFGEWVPCVLHNLSNAVLVEASKPQFDKLVENYKKIPNVKMINNIVSTDGNPVEFFEGGLGYTNSVVERVIRGWEKEEINSSVKESVSINSLIDDKIDWLHLDVEGYDAKLLMALQSDKLPNLIIFEYENLKEEENDQVKKYLINLGYELEYRKVSCLAIKKS
jgi:hypothetical protein